MICLDTNILIYITDKTLSRTLLSNVDAAYSTITKIEALGYGKITAIEQSILEQLFEEYEHLTINDSIIQRTIIIRQRHNIKLSDAIIAATAIENDCVLWTANDVDFQKVSDLKLFNPLNKK